MQRAAIIISVAALGAQTGRAREVGLEAVGGAAN
jgi:hypothetical protein